MASYFAGRFHWGLAMKSILAAAALALVTASSANAATLFQSIPDLTAVPVQASYCSSCNAFLPFRIYDTFDLASDATINSVTFAIDTRFSPGGSTNVGFFNLNGALPGAAIANFTVAAADYLLADTQTDFIKLVTFDIGALALGAGSYDISFYNPNGLGVPAYADAGGKLYHQGNFFQPSQFYAGRSAGFTLGGVSAVPEPGAWAMMIVGFGLAGGAIRATRRSALLSPA